jgi:PAS domain S-box-containing protein
MGQSGLSSGQVDVLVPDVQGYTIMLIEDNPDHQLLESKALRTLGPNVHVLTFATALEGLTALEKQDFELVVTDYRTPGMDGLEFLDAVNERHITVPVVIVTGLGNERVAVHALKHGAYDYVIKESGYLELLPSIAERAIASFRTQRQLEYAQKKLADSEDRYRQLVHGLDAIVWEADSDWHFTLVSRRAEAMLGYPADRWIKDPTFWASLIHPGDRDQTLEHCRRTVAERRDREFEYRAITHNGRVLWLRAIVRLIFDGDEVRGLRGLMVDITERKKMEEELLRAQKLESIGLLAGGIAHDFNNILMAIIGNISIASMEAPPNSRIVERLTAAERASLQAKDLTQQLLTFSKGGAPIKSTASVANLIRDSANFALRGSNVRCEMVIPDDLWPIEVDQGQMNQVINNLIINADEAMPDGGIIAVRAENVTLDTDSPAALPLRPGTYVKLTIFDQGIGIPPEHLSRIFDPYFTTKQKGSGLGLATAYSIIKKHDGYITVESRLGAGTSFTILLPASANQAPAASKGEGHPLRGKGRVLVMDDEDLIRDVVGQMLEYIGYEPDFARDGAEAIERYRMAKETGRPFRAVIADLTIAGGMGGREAIKKLLEFDPDAKAIVSSGYSNNPIMANYRKYGFCGVVAKPYEIQKLSDELYKVIHGLN